MRPTAAIYVRISNDETREGVGVERQIKDCKALAEKQGWAVGEVFRDNDTSAYKRKRNAQGVLRVVRPEFTKMLQGFVDQNFHTMVAYNLDRVARDPRDLEDLIDIVQEAKIKVASVSGDLRLDSDDAIAMARVMVAFANKASADTSRRVTRAMIDLAANGGFTGGGRRFGYNQDCTQLHADEAEILKGMYDKVLAGESLRSIQRALQDEGVKGARGNTITVSNVNLLLRRPMHAGFATYKGQIVGKSQAPKIISEAKWKKVIAILDDASRKSSVGKPAKSLLAPFLYCDKCKTKMGKVVRSGHASSYVYYGCASRCRHVRLEALDAHVADVLLTKIAKDLANVKPPVKITKATPAHEVEAAKWRDELADLQRMFAAGEISAKTFGAGSTSAETKLAALEKLTAKAAGKPATEALTKGKDIYAAWAAMDDEGRRQVIREEIDKIVVGPSVRGEPLDMSNVKIDWK